MKFLVSRIIPLIFAVIGALFVVFGVRGLIRSRASLSWPTAQGKVVASSVERAGDTRETYRAKILYEFAVDGATFNGDRVAYGDFHHGDPHSPLPVVRRYPKGRVVTVHYMPGNPEECLLEPGLKAQHWFYPGVGLVFFTLGSLGVVFLGKVVWKQ
jgi:hypothetical protein